MIDKLMYKNVVFIYSRLDDSFLDISSDGWLHRLRKYKINRDLHSWSYSLDKCWRTAKGKEWIESHQCEQYDLRSW